MHATEDARVRCQRTVQRWVVKLTCCVGNRRDDVQGVHVFAAQSCGRYWDWSPRYTGVGWASRSDAAIATDHNARFREAGTAHAEGTARDGFNV